MSKIVNKIRHSVLGSRLVDLSGETADPIDLEPTNLQPTCERQQKERDRFSSLSAAQGESPWDVGWTSHKKIRALLGRL